MRNHNSELEIRIRGRGITEYTHEGMVFVEGRHRSEFEIYLKNNSSRQRLFIPSVDGLSVVNGKPASSNSPGFVIDGYDSIIIPGWMTDSNHAAKFYFSLSNKEPSYSEKMGYSDKNNGVIGVRIFDKSEKRLTPSPFTSPAPVANQGIWNSSGNPSRDLPRGICSVSVNSFLDGKELGTGWGEETYFSTTEVEFEKNLNSVCDLVIFYDTREGLKARGVDIINKKSRRSTMGAAPFPGDYCQPPK